MRSTAGLAVFALIALGVVAFGWARNQAIRRVQHEAITGSVTPSLGEPEKHKVTPSMMRAAQSHANTVSPAFRLSDAENVTQDLGEMLKSGPVVLLFIKDGCPCSISAEAYFNSLHALYRGRLQFLGVIDGDATIAKRWAATQGVPFPILPDPGLTLAKKYSATNSAFVALIGTDGTIEQFWPGYSASMLQDLNRAAAKLANLPLEPLETGDAPSDLYSGCPFFDN